MNLIHLEQVDPAKIVYTCTKTEQKVIRLVQEELPFKEIATSLGVSAVRASKIFYYADKKNRGISDEEVINTHGQNSLMRVKEFDNPQRRTIRSIFWAHRLRTLEQIAQFSYKELSAAYEIPKNSLNIVVKILAKYGLPLKDWQEYKRKIKKIKVKSLCRKTQTF